MRAFGQPLASCVNSMPLLQVLIALTFVAVSVALALLPRRDVRAPALSLFRSVFPAWRFFEEIAPAPRLSARIAHADRFGVWHDIPLALPARTPRSLVLDAPVNLALALQALVERLASDCDPQVEGETLERSVSYQLVQALVRARLPEAERTAGARYQFRLTSDEGEILLSALHDFSEA
jgi:hypothetical protein